MKNKEIPARELQQLDDSSVKFIHNFSCIFKDILKNNLDSIALGFG